MIEITFLGTVSGIPSKDRNHPAIAIEYYSWRKHTLLFDCGEGTQLQLMKAGISFMEIDRIFITHWHADHFAGLIPLISTMNMEKRKKTLEVYAPESTKFIKKILDLGYFGLRFPVRPVDIPFEGDNIVKVLEEKEFEILSIPACHNIPSVAFCLKEKDKWSINEKRLKELGLKRGRWLKKLKIKGEVEYRGRKVKLEEVADFKKGLKIVYTGDTKPCENILKIAKDADILIHDATFFEEDKVRGTGHTNIKQACRLARKANVKKLILTHVSRRYTNLKELEEEAKKFFPNSEIAYDFMKIKLK